MKRFKLKRKFQIQLSARKVKTYQPGVYDVPKQMTDYHAIRAEQMRVGEFLPAEKKAPLAEKKAPENKVVKSTETKAPAAKSKKKVAKKRRSSTRPKSDT